MIAIRQRLFKPKFHFADFPETSQFGEVGVMENGLKGASRVCRGRHGKVGIVEFRLYYTPYTAAGRASVGDIWALSSRFKGSAFAEESIEYLPLTPLQPVYCTICRLLYKSLHASTDPDCTVWVKKVPPLRFFWHFPPNVWEFLVQILYACYTCTFPSTLDFIQLPATLTKLCHIERDHRHMLKMSTIDRNARWVVALNMA